MYLKHVILVVRYYSSPGEINSSHLTLLLWGGSHERSLRRAHPDASTTRAPHILVEYVVLHYQPTHNRSSCPGAQIHRHHRRSRRNQWHVLSAASLNPREKNGLCLGSSTAESNVIWTKASLYSVMYPVSTNTLVDSSVISRMARPKQLRNEGASL